MSVNTGDILFQLFSMLFLATIIIGVFLFFRSQLNQKKQLIQMEKTINEMREELKRKK